MRTSSLILSAACFCLTGAAVAKDFDHDFAGEKPAVQTADRLEWAWDGDDHFSVGGRAIVHYQKAGQPRIIVRGPADLLSHVRYDHGRLEMDSDDWNFFATRDEKLDVTLTGMTLRQIALAGSGEIQMGEIAQDRLALSIAGSGSFDASGKVDELSLHIAGSGHGDLDKLASTSLRADIAGSGKLEAGTAERADISISGSGKVHFAGPMPKQIATSVNGSGMISDSDGRVISRRQARRDRDYRER